MRKKCHELLHGRVRNVKTELCVFDYLIITRPDTRMQLTLSGHEVARRARNILKWILFFSRTLKKEVFGDDR